MKKEGSINIGVVGVGHLGNFHLKQLGGIPQVSISGLYDSNPKRAEEMSFRYNVPVHTSLEELLSASDAVSVVTPTSYHYEVADKALDADCHLFIEKPITDNIEHARLLLEKAVFSSLFFVKFGWQLNWPHNHFQILTEHWQYPL